MTQAPLHGRTVAITADRRGREQAELFTSRGASVIHGPTMCTVDLRSDAQLRTTTEDLIEHPPHWLVATTGMGMRYWFDAAQQWGVADDLLAALGAARIVARGAKATSALRKAGLEPEWRAPSETMREIRDYLLGHDLTGTRVAVQLFDPVERAELSRLTDAAGEVVGVGVYRWQLPDDLGPARSLIDAVIAGRVDAVTFTSQPAVRYLFRIAADADHVRDALNTHTLAVCIGPVCAEALVEHGITQPIWPEPNRLVPMVKLVTDQLS